MIFHSMLLIYAYWQTVLYSDFIAHCNTADAAEIKSVTCLLVLKQTIHYIAMNNKKSYFGNFGPLVRSEDNETFYGFSSTYH